MWHELRLLLQRTYELADAALARANDTAAHSVACAVTSADASAERLRHLRGRQTV